MRLLVGFLGERAQFSWWPTAFFEASSQPFLEPAFPKTLRLAQYHGVLEAARHLHDEHLNVGCYHLFRFPEEVEQDLHELMRTEVCELIIKEKFNKKQTALDTLVSMADIKSPSGVGPLNVGNIKDVDSSKTLKAIAGSYATAFDQKIKTYPYLLS